MHSLKILVLTAALAALAACGESSSSGDDAGTSAGLDASASTASDGGTATDAGLGEPMDFTITVSDNCAFSACGGDLVGTWDYTALCIPKADVVSSLTSVCSTATLISATGTGKGRVTLTAMTVTRDVSWSGTATFNIPAACTLGSCANAQAALRQAGFPTATCTGTTDCSCTLALSDTLDDVNSYTKTATQVQITGGDTYDYCVSGTSLSYRDVTDGSDELGVATLVKR